MKKIFAKLALILSVLFFVPLSFADHPHYCPNPDINKMQEAIFKFARPKNLNGAWTLISLPFFNQGRNWSIAFDIYLPNVKTPEELLRIGQDFFKIIKLPAAYTYYLSEESGWCDYGSNVTAFYEG